MRTTLDLPEKLLEEAMSKTKIKTKTALIIKALEDIIRKTEIKELKNFKGKVNLDIDIALLRKRK